jgi:hypothetical protein
MADYWAATGQLDRASIAAWDAGGRDEHGFYALGTQASYGSGWELSAWSADADTSWSGAFRSELESVGW